MSVADFYANRCVLITGATGFMGKVMLEKLLRSCPNVERVYLLVRQKGQLSPQERVTSLLESELFSLARKENPNLAEKVVAVGGELSETNLGVSDEDFDLLINKVNIIFHVAATVKFNEKIKIAVTTNVVVVRRMLDFAKRLRNGLAFVHTSTAYAHTNRDCIEEVVYPPCFDPQKLINIMDALDESMAESLTPGLVGVRPNTYTFTKSIAEGLVAAERPPFPTAIIRPSIISSVWKEPFPGWIDNFNGPAGMSLAFGTGVLRVVTGNCDLQADIIPVDVVASYALSVPWFIAHKEPASEDHREVRVFNVTSGGPNGCKWGTWATTCLSTFRKYPLEKYTFRRPRLSVLPKRSWEYWARHFIWHQVPAKVTDLLIWLQGKPPKMIKTFERLDRIVDEYCFFTTHQWKWDNHNGAAMLAAMSAEDRRMFDFDTSTIHWLSFIESQCVGLKKFLLREDMTRLDVALYNQRKMMLLNFMTKTIGLVLLVRLLLPLLRRRGLLRSAWMLLLPALMMIKA